MMTPEHGYVLALASLVISQAATAIALIGIRRQLRDLSGNKMLKEVCRALINLTANVDAARKSLAGSVAVNSTAVKTSLDRAIIKLETLAAQQRMAPGFYQK